MPKQSELEHFLKLQQGVKWDIYCNDFDVLENKYHKLSNNIIKQALFNNPNIIKLVHKYSKFGKVDSLKNVLKLSETLSVLVGYHFALYNYKNFKRDQKKDFAYDLFDFIIHQKFDFRKKEGLVVREFVNENLEEVWQNPDYRLAQKTLEMEKEYENISSYERICSLHNYDRNTFLTKFYTSLKIYKKISDTPKHNHNQKYDEVLIRKIKQKLQN